MSSEARVGFRIMKYCTSGEPLRYCHNGSVITSARSIQGHFSDVIGMLPEVRTYELRSYELLRLIVSSLTLP